MTYNILSSPSPFSSQHKARPKQADSRGQEEKPAEHVHGEDDEELIAHLGLEAQGGEGPESDAGRDQKRRIQHRFACGGHALGQSRSKLRPVLATILLDGARDDVDAVIDAKPDPEADDRHRVDVEAHVPESHDGGAEHVGEKDHADEQKTRQHRAEAQGAKN